MARVYPRPYDKLEKVALEPHSSLYYRVNGILRNVIATDIKSQHVDHRKQFGIWSDTQKRIMVKRFPKNLKTPLKIEF